MISKPRILVLLVSGLYNDIFVPKVDSQLRALGELTFNTKDRNISSYELAQIINGHDAIISGWGSPKFTDEVLDSANRLKLVTHSAGSIIKILPPAVFDRGIKVTHAAVAIAPAVAEMTISLILLSLRQVHKLDHSLKSGDSWPWGNGNIPIMGQELAGNRVGLVGAGYTGRCVIDLLRAFNTEVWVYDPYLSDKQATVLDVSKVELDEIFAGCPIVTIQAPLTTDTYHMVGASQLALLKDGSVFINTARSAIVDQKALLAELTTGRIRGAIDVFNDEPLPEDSPFRQLDNLIITPHIAGYSKQARYRQGLIILEEMRRFFEGKPLLHEVTGDMLHIMA
jgi:phosphoglycerate dehydrogenase-like enzyme